LLDRAAMDRQQRALEILDRVLTLQDPVPESRTYGIWPWFLEEPLEQMSPPDWNWADFCGTSLIQIAMDHRPRLPEKIQERLDQAIIHAARSIQHRDVGPDYTNIALMGTYVTYTAGEFYQQEELLNYARRRLRRFVAYTADQGAFTEFNSPTYTVVALRVLARMRRDIHDAGAHPLLDRLYDLAWADVARHFHPPTRQWAGPHSRAYTTLLRPGTMAFLQRAIGNQLPAFGPDDLPPDLEAYRLSVSCPAQYIPLLLDLKEPREVIQVYHKGSPKYPRIVGRTYLDETVAVGTMSRGDFWNQRRPLVAYWGTADHPTALQLRCLHDEYDYSSGLIFACQAGPYVLGGVAFATDYGDRHISLDLVSDQAILARDLRLRFQIIHPPSGWVLPNSFPLGERRSWQVGNATLSLHVPYATFGGWEPNGQAQWDGEDGCLDVVLYHGPQRQLDFGQIQPAAVVFALQVASAAAGGALPTVEIERDAGMLTASWDTPRGSLTMTIPERPGPLAEIQALAEGMDGA
jgi:hypothetical protein